MPINYNRYPPNWKTEIRPRILSRAKNCCEFCGLKNHAEGIRRKDELVSLDEFMNDCALNLKSTLLKFYGKNFDTLKHIKIVLTIAHLDHDEENWDVKDDRLAALCQKCHLKYDAPEKARRKQLKKNQTELFK